MRESGCQKEAKGHEEFEFGVVHKVDILENKFLPGEKILDGRLKAFVKIGHWLEAG
jgi:hypothetical protein